MGEKSKGQAALEAVMGFVGSYMAMTDELLLVVSVWIIQTWVSEYFDSTAYLAIQGPPGVGKSRLLELLAMLCRNTHVAGDLRPATLLRMIHDVDGRCTMLFDEAEKLSSGSASDIRSVLNLGYRKGAIFDRMKPGTQEMFHYRVYCPKAIAQLGDSTATLRSRSIPIRLEKGVPRKSFSFATANAEASKIVRLLESGVIKRPAGEWVSWLTDRDQEIWACMFGTLSALEVDENIRKRLGRASADLRGAKKADPTYYREIEAKAATSSDGIDSREALHDLLDVLRPGEKGIYSDVAVERMRDLEFGQWRTYKGHGLDVEKLAALVKLWVSPVPMRLGGRKVAAKRGYRADHLRAAGVAAGLLKASKAEEGVTA